MDRSTAGAQSLRRGLQLLRLLAEHQEDGIRLSEAMAASGLQRSTCHRLLACLVEEQFAERDAGGKVYRLGVDAMQLGFAAMRWRSQICTLLRSAANSAMARPRWLSLLFSAMVSSAKVLPSSG